ncbi:CBS domain-containing protein [Candidatus Parabeggiatoa sp. HSG14]|uniref:CBS domain-containing protein n=1 Tax=Candidatus Parabeggiatoa sp. HSG14 TaxID=3055593 RepID=UPI0025A91F05|nr:CBS domain-containing protein [Thiotrichales bacterium HSG14]
MNGIKKLVRVHEVMKTEFDRVDGLTTVAEALRNMKYPEARSLIVNKRHPDDEFGMLFLMDIARHVLAKDRSPERVNVYEIMAKPVITVSPQMDIRYCARLFDRYNILRAPVIEHNDVIGIVGFSDIVLRGMLECLHDK